MNNITLDDLDRVLQLVLKLLVPQLNNHLNDGVPLPPLQPFFNLSKSELTLFDRYMRIDFNPEPCKQHFSEAIRQSYAKIQADIAKRRLLARAQASDGTSYPTLKWLLREA